MGLRRGLRSALALALGASMVLGPTAAAHAAGPSPAARPAGARDHAPTQRAGAVDLPPTSPASGPRSPRSGGPGGRALPPVVRPAVPAAATVRTAVSPVGTAVGFRPATSTERPARRTATSTVFDNADGTSTLRLFSSPAYVQQPDGTYLPIDLNLQASAGRYVPRTGPAVSFAATGRDPELAATAVGAGRVALGLTGAAAVPAAVTGQSATYPGILPNVDLTVTATAGGVKDDLVLRSPAAPTSYTYPLRLAGVTPRYAADSGNVEFVDAAGAVALVIPAGSMTDANVDPGSGDGAISHGVRYAVLGDAAHGWSLRMDLDAAWLADPTRRFPVTVDPATQLDADADDTYVTNTGSSNNSGDVELRAGTYDGGTDVAASYLHFSGLTSQLHNDYIVGASVNVLNVHSYSCAGRAVDMYTVTQSWSGSSMTSWPGATLGPKLASLTFAHGASGCPDAGWASFPVDPDSVTSWVHGTALFYGVSLRASTSDTLGWKKFASADTPTATNRPYMDVTYAAQGAAYLSATVTKPTNNTAGQATVTVRNLGSGTWSAGGTVKLHAYYRQGSTPVGDMVTPVAPSVVVPPNSTTNITLTLPPIAPGSYTLLYDMWDSMSFHDHYGVPYGSSDLTVDNLPPVPVDEQPQAGADVNTLKPTLYADGNDPDQWPGTPLQFAFRFCDGPDPGTVACANSGWTGHTWVPPNPLQWGRTYYWWVQADDGHGTAGLLGPLALATVVPQPEITAHLAGGDAVSSAGAPGVDPQVGNYTTAQTDASVPTVGPELAVTRTYNSLDTRRGNAFGAGWSSTLDTRLSTVDDGTADVVVTLPTGQQVRFGASADGTAYTPPVGRNLTLTHAAGQPYRVREVSGTRWDFDAGGRLTTVTDPAGRTQSLAYNGSGQVTSLVDNASGRTLTVDWSGAHVSAVRTDAAVAGGVAPQWTYGYDGDRLTSVCAPGDGTACTHYTYQQGSHYRSVVLDDNPSAYWRLDESSGSTAASVAARTPGADAGAYVGPTLGAAGALTATADTAAHFNGTSSLVTLPQKLVSPTMSLAVELWFRTGTAGGVLLSYQDQPFPLRTPSLWTPVLYLGTDGKLRGGFWANTGTTHIVSTAAVTDNAWHHVVLSGSVSSQSMYLDGQLQGTMAGTIDHNEQIYLTLGAGRVQGWPSTGGGNAYFTGDIDEVAYYRHPLGLSAARAHHSAGTSAAEQLTHITWPQDDREYATIGYDGGTDRVRTLTDEDGGTWTLDAPTRNGAARTAVLHHSGAADLTFGYDADHGGRITSRQRGTDPARTYAYADNGFLAQLTDENGNWVKYTTDARGNILTGQSCQTATVCGTTYYTYYLNAADPLDPRNDNLLTVADARSSGPADARYRTTYTYTAAGEVATTTGPLPAGQTAAPVEHRDYTAGTEAAVGGGTEPPGLLARVTDPRGATTSYAYTSTGDLARVTGPTGLLTENAYDRLGRVTSTTTSGAAGAFATTAYTYTAKSQPASVTGPQVTDPVSHATHQLSTVYTYDADGNLTRQAESDVDSADPPRTTAYGYDAHDRLTTLTNPDGGVRTDAYSTFGDLVSRTDVSGYAWTYGYDDRHHLTQTAIPAGQPDSAAGLVLERRSYDPAGRLTAVQDALGRTTDYDYLADNTRYRARLDTTGIPGAIPSQTLWTRSFDLAGHLTRTVGLGGVTTVTQSWDNAGLLGATTLDPAGLNRVSTATRDAAGNLTSVSLTGAANPGRTETTDYGYDAANRLASTTVHNDAGALLTTALQRDERGLITRRTDPRGNATDLGYDATGALSTVAGPAITTWVGGHQTTGVRPTTTFARNTYGDPVARRDPDGNVTTAGYDAMGRVVSTVAPTYTPPGGTALTPTSTAAYNHAGLPTTLTDPLGHATTLAYNRFGQPLTSTGPAVAAGTPVTTYAYNAVGDLTSVTDPAGAVTTATYDELDRPTTSTAADRVPGPQTAYYTTGYGYDAGGNLGTVTSPQGNTTALAYNPAGERTRLTDPTNRAWQATYDLAGRPATTTDSAGLRTSYGYDLAGRLTTLADTPAGASTPARTRSAAYDADGNLTGTTSAENRQVTYAYDAVGELTQQTERPTATTTVTTGFGYDAAGNLTRYTDGNNHPTDYTYNPLGLPETTVEPSTTAQPNAADRTWTYAYDAAGQLTRRDEPGAVTQTTTYDAQGRVLTQHGTGPATPTADRTFGYDLSGRLTHIDGAGGTTYAYDDRGNLVSTAGAAGNATLTYNGDGTLATRTDAAGTATYTYDKAARPSTMDDPLTATTITYSYDTAGRPSTTTYGTTGHRDYTYDPLGRLATDDQTFGTTTHTTYAYDRDDNLTARVRNTTTTDTYAYDGLNRLTSWTPPAASAVTYTWDAAGNRTTAGSTTYTYDERNRLTSDGTTTYTWTPRGTLSSAGPRTLTFDALDRLTADAATTYTYDSLDRLSGPPFQYGDLTNNTATATGERETYTPDGTPAAAKPAATSPRYLLTDQHGDITAWITPGTTPTTTRQTYDPFGAPQSTPAAAPTHGYQSAWTNPTTGAVNMAARWYTPALGTFLSRDPAPLPAAPSAAMSRYTYANANPLRYTDPTGRYASAAGTKELMADGGGSKGGSEMGGARGSTGGGYGEPAPPAAPYRPGPVSDPGPRSGPRTPPIPMGGPYSPEFNDVPPGWPYDDTPPGSYEFNDTPTRDKKNRPNDDSRNPQCGASCAQHTPPPCDLTCHNLITPVDRDPAGSHTADRRRSTLPTKTSTTPNKAATTPGKGTITPCTATACATTDPKQPTPAAGGGTGLKPPTTPPTAQTSPDPDEPEDGVNESENGGTAPENVQAEDELSALERGAAKVPEDWGPGMPNRKGVGMRWTDPSNPGSGIRIDQGTPGSGWPSQQVDHVVVRSGGRIIGPDGKPIVGSLAENPQAHIRLSDWLNWLRWNHP